MTEHDKEIAEEVVDRARNEWGEQDLPTYQELINFINLKILKLHGDKDQGVGRNAEAINKSIAKQIMNYQSLKSMVIYCMEEDNE